jgi:glucoamylase
MPFNGATGDVTVTINGASATGPKPITNSCPSDGVVNFNPVVGSVTSGSGGGGSGCANPVSNVDITFNEIVTTQFGEEVYIVGSIAQLGTWDPAAAIHLDSSKYTDSNNLWFIDVTLPAGTSFEYKYIRKETDGSIIWESDPNRSFTVPTGCSSTAVENDSWR